MRQITKDIQLTIDGNSIGFRLTKLDAFSGIMLLRLLMRLEETERQGRFSCSCSVLLRAGEILMKIRGKSGAGESVEFSALYCH